MKRKKFKTKKRLWIANPSTKCTTQKFLSCIRLFFVHHFVLYAYCCCWRYCCCCTNDFKQSLREWLFQIFLLTWYSIRNRPSTETTYNKKIKKFIHFYNKVSEYISILKIHIIQKNMVFCIILIWFVIVTVTV